MDEDEVRQLIRAAVNAAGGERQFAEQIGVSRQWINAVLTGARRPSGKILDIIGVEAVAGYRRIRRGAAPQESRAALRRERDELAERLAQIEAFQPGITAKARAWVAQIDKPRRRRR